jgi:hypothetical protein
MEELPIEDGCVRPEIRDLAEGEWPQAEDEPITPAPVVVYELIF